MQLYFFPYECKQGKTGKKVKLQAMKNFLFLKNGLEGTYLNWRGVPEAREGKGRRGGYSPNIVREFSELF